MRVHWFDATEVSPPECGEYLVCDWRQYDTIEVAFFNSRGGWDVTADGAFADGLNEITHYAQLPAMPTDYGDEESDSLRDNEGRYFRPRAEYVKETRPILGEPQ